MSSDDGNDAPDTAQITSAGDDLRLVLVVMHGHEVLRCRLPATGTIVMGRSRECNVVIDDATVSRQHARLHIGPKLALEDLGSSNGTLVDGEALTPNVLFPIDLDHVLRLGVVTALVQQVASTVAPAVVSPERLRQAIAGRPAAGALAVVRIALDRPAEPDAVAAVASAALREGDVIAQPDPSTLEVAVHASTAGAVEALVTQLLAACREQLSEGQVATRLVPRDGIDPVALLDEATRAMTPVLGDPLVVVSAPMRALYELADQVATGQLSVLVTGETGVGKEHLAEHIHRASGRADEPFVRINCAAFAESLFEAEFFGYERGAFTGANQAKVGLLEHAGGGTVFLDEVGELPLQVQAKFLRVLEERQLMRIGSLKPRPVNARFVAATNRPLESEVARGAFRKDLYFRLAGVVLEIPPLRERGEEILPMARRFAARAAHDLGRTRIPVLSNASCEALLAARWDGNVRELRNAMERAVLLCRGDSIEPNHLMLTKAEPVPGPAVASASRATMPTLPPPVAADAADDKQGQHERLVWALEQCGGNQKAAARLLGISRQTIGKWIDRYGVARPRRARGDE